MNIYAISDLHLPGGADKPMEVFGENWSKHFKKIKEDWLLKVKDDDIVLLSGDFSWAMTTDTAEKDFELLGELTGNKILIKGNHDYWWSSISKLREKFKNFNFIQNDAKKIGNYVICGTRGWLVPGSPEFSKADEKIYKREVQRLLMSVSSAKKLAKNGAEIIGMMHFPPFNAHKDGSDFTQIIQDAGIKKVVYGHLHGAKSRTDLITVKNNVEYFLTSCDKLDFKLLKIY